MAEPQNDAPAPATKDPAEGGSGAEANKPKVPSGPGSNLLGPAGDPAEGKPDVKED